MKQLEGKVVEILDALAAQLGVASEHLWEVLVRQQFVEAIMYSVLTVILAIAGYQCLRLFRWGRIEDAKGGYSEAGPVTMIVGIVGIGAFSIAGTILLLTAIGKLINPHYYAIQDILRLVTGSG